MAKSSKRPKTGTKEPKVKDLRAKNTGHIKGGIIAAGWDLKQMKKI